MVTISSFRSHQRGQSFLIFFSLSFILFILTGCSPHLQPEDLKAVEYTPLPGDDWKVSTPANQGLNPMLVAELYYNAAEQIA